MAYSKAAILALLWIILIAQSLGLLHIAGRDTHRRNVFDGDAAWFFFPVVELKVPVALQYANSATKAGHNNRRGRNSHRSYHRSTNVDFAECLESLAANSPAHIIVVTGGQIGNYERACEYKKYLPSLTVIHSSIANKRAQICQGLKLVGTRITILCDDHVFWPARILASMLAPFESRSVGAVGTKKRVRRSTTDICFAGFWNFLGCLYLERHNFELAATNCLDGGVFVISGRTAAYRTGILRNSQFINGFLSEYTFFGLFGPLNADDDNFITRWCVNHGWQIKFQYSDECTIETTLGEYPRFLSQCLRWVRTTWRSNATSLFVDRTVWRRQPWCVYAVYLASLFNFALFYDAALLWTLYNALNEYPAPERSTACWVACLGLWILASKLVKPFPHFRQHPKDLLFLPGYILFGYYHSLIKLYALITFWDVAWSGRPNLTVKTS